MFCFSFGLYIVFVFLLFGHVFRGGVVFLRGFVGIMANAGVRGLMSLTRRHGVKVAAEVSVEKCCLAVGEVVGYDSILSASRMNSAIVVFLSAIEKANEIVQNGIVLDGILTPVLPLSLPSKRVTISNVPPFITDEVLTKALSRYGKLISSIKKIPIGGVSPLLKHVVSFRRSVYMIVNEDSDLDLALNFRVDDYDYVVFITTDRIKCFGCGVVGHLIRNCPNKQGRHDRAADAEGAANGAERPADEVLAAEAPAAVEPETAEVNDHNRAHEVEVPGDATVSVEEECKDTTVIEKGESSDKLDGDVAGGDVREIDGNETDAEQIVFKVPLKRKSYKVYESPCVKKVDLELSADQTETESDSELSDSSASLSQSDFVARNYEVEDIKLFLRSTKNKRGVRVNEYFPDAVQFLEKTKFFMSEGCFSNKEVFRLRKIVRKLSMNLNDGNEKV